MDRGDIDGRGKWSRSKREVARFRPFFSPLPSILGSNGRVSLAVGVLAREPILLGVFDPNMCTASPCGLLTGREAADRDRGDCLGYRFDRAIHRSMRRRYNGDDLGRRLAYVWRLDLLRDDVRCQGLLEHGEGVSRECAFRNEEVRRYIEAKGNDDLSRSGYESMLP